MQDCLSPDGVLGDPATAQAVAAFFSKVLDVQQTRLRQPLGARVTGRRAGGGGAWAA